MEAEKELPMNILENNEYSPSKIGDSYTMLYEKQKRYALKGIGGKHARDIELKIQSQRRQ